jgi:myo-inositol-1(or 4)-monophosphatase
MMASAAGGAPVRIRYNLAWMSLRPAEDELLAVACRAAQAASAELLSRWGREPADVHSKSTPTDPVSAADMAAERAIRAVLGSERPADAILGEEGGATDGQGGQPGDGALRWVVDPLDGTVNYLYGIPQFAVSVACEDADGALVGVVYNPLSRECFAATRSGPATLDGEPIEGSRRAELGRSLVATGFAYDPAVRAAQAQVITRVLPRARDIRRAGAAALDLCACACGRVDAYYERGVRHWDYAAGALICARAGLTVRRLEAVPAGPADPVALPDGLLVAPEGLVDELESLVGSGPAID